MRLYRVWAKFEPHAVPGRHGLKSGQWRVIHYWEITCGDQPWLIPISSSIGDNELSILSSKPYRCGCIIRPHKELNRVFAARKRGEA